MNKVDIEILSYQEIKKIKLFQRPIDIGSDISCYLYDKNTVIKMFEITCQKPSEKFFIPNEIYGNNSYIFTNKIQKNKDGILISYTQPFIRGDKLNPYSFNELSIDNLLIFITQLIQDTLPISNNGIFTYDSFISNIILNNQGFHNIDTIDFQCLDKDPTIIQKENLKIFFINFWDILMGDDLKYFCIQNGLDEYFLYEDPYNFFIELTNKVQELSNKKISHIKDIKILTKKRTII